MKKIFIPLLSVLLSLACSLQSFALPAPTFTPAPTATETHTPLPTATPITPTLTFTSTPTLIGFRSPTPTPSVTNTPEFTSTVVLVIPDTPTATIEMKGFLSVTISVNEFYKGTECEPYQVRVKAQMKEQNIAAHVLLFVRFKSMKAERLGKWTSIPMEDIGAGTFIHDLSSGEIREDAYFQTAWVEYQIVATNAAGTEVGRTPIFKERLAMYQCSDRTPTPIATVTP